MTSRSRQAAYSNSLMNALSIVSNEKKELIEFIGHDRRFYERCTIEYVMGIIGRIKCRELKVAGWLLRKNVIQSKALTGFKSRSRKAT